MTNLPRIRVHDSGRIALYYPDPDGDEYGMHWLTQEPLDGSDEWCDDAGVSGPGWRDAVVVPLPEPDEIHERAGARWGAGDRSDGDVWATWSAIWCEGRLCGAKGARRLAAALLAAADHLDRAAAPVEPERITNV